MKRQKKRGELNKNSGNDEKYKVSYCFALLEGEFLKVILWEIKGKKEDKFKNRRTNNKEEKGTEELGYWKAKKYLRGSFST